MDRMPRKAAGNTKPPQGRETIETLRAGIDRIDDDLVRLLGARMEAVAQISAVKSADAGGFGLRPAREAHILARMLAARAPAFPAPAFVRIWREIISAGLWSQAPFSVHVVDNEETPGFAPLARASFGSNPPIEVHSSIAQVMNACSATGNAIGILPAPATEERGAPWWAQLAGPAQRGARVFARLPFTDDPASPEKFPEALAIADIPFEAAAGTNTLIVIEALAQLSRAKLGTLLKQAQIAARVISSGRPEGAAGSYFLIETDTPAPADDPRLAALSGRNGELIARAFAIGGTAPALGVAGPETPS